MKTLTEYLKFHTKTLNAKCRRLPLLYRPLKPGKLPVASQQEAADHQVAVIDSVCACAGACRIVKDVVGSVLQQCGVFVAVKVEPAKHHVSRRINIVRIRTQGTRYVHRGELRTVIDGSLGKVVGVH